jgi:ribonucleoside-triphosphate reductase
MNREKAIERVDSQINEVTGKLNDPGLCKGTAEAYTRVSGYYRPVSAFNSGKAQEVEERKAYCVA